MFSFFSWNAQAQIPPRGSFTQKCRFAFGEWLAFRGSDACPARGLCWVFTNTGVSVPGTVLGWGQGAVCCLCRSPGQAAQSPGLLLVLAELASPLCSLGMGSAHLAALLQCDGLSLGQAPAVSGPGPCCASSCSTPFQLP